MNGEEHPSKRSFTPRESVCPFCGVGCGIRYDPERGTAQGWSGPVNARGEVCPKGVAAGDVVEHPERLTEPLVREGDELRPATWDEALARVVESFTTIRDRYGPDALFFFASSNCTNEENYLLQRLARALGTNNVDNCARLCHSSTVAAMAERLGAGAMTNTLDDLRESDCLLVWGANPADQHPIAFRSYLLPAVRAGATLVHVDPRETTTTRAADLHLPVRPGYDIPLANAMAGVIVQEGRDDEAFLDERVTDVERFTAFAESVDVAETAALAGVDAERVREAARAYADADRAAVLTGMGTSQHHYGTANVHALVNLVLATGNLGQRGTGLNPLRGQNNVQGAGDVGALPDLLPGYRPVTHGDARTQVADVWGFDPPATPGLTEVEATHTFGDGVRGAFVFGENPAVTEPNASEVADRLAALDCLVVLDIFETETAAYADVVLPGSAWAEKSGTVTNTDRQVMRMHASGPPPGDARRDFDVLRTLARRLTDRPFAFEDPAAAFAELRRVVPQYAGIRYDAIGTGSARWPFPEGAREGTDVLHRERFANGSRTADLRVVDHVPPADPVGEEDLVLTTGRVLQHFNSGALSRRSDTLSRQYPTDALRIHPDDAAPRDVADGDRVRVESDRGAVTVDAAVTPLVRRGVVFLTFHFADPLVNTLTGDVLDPVAKIPEYKHTAVRVRPA